MMPGSVHDVKFRKNIVVMIDRMKRIGMAGLTSQIFPNMKMQYGIRMITKHIYTSELAPQSRVGPDTHPHRKNAFFPGHT